MCDELRVMPSRRTVLGAGAVAAVPLGAVSTVRSGPIQTLDPPDDSWPQHRYDAANTARTDLSIPSEPTTEWSRRAVGRSFPSLVVGNEAVFAGGAGITALDRSTGRRRWHEDAAGNELALVDVGSDEPTLYVAHGVGPNEPDERSPALRAYDATDGTERWRHEIPTPAYGLVPTEAGVVLGCHGTLLAVGRNGRRHWTEEPPGSGAVHPMIHEGTLYAGLPGYVRRYRRRRHLALLFGSPPDVGWQGSDTSGAGPPTAACGNLVMGTEQAAFESTDPVVHAFDLASGERQWGAGPRTATRRRMLTPVQFGNTGLTAIRVTDGDDDSETTFVAGIDLRDGGVEFRRPVNGWFRRVAAGTDCAVFGGRGGDLRAYWPDGRERWQTEVAAPITDLAVLDGRVIVAQANGDVTVLE